MAKTAGSIRKWLQQFNSEAAIAVYGQGDGAALIECGGHRFLGVGGETQVRYDHQPLKLAIEKLRAVRDQEPSMVLRNEIAQVLECLELSEPMCTCGQEEGDHVADCPRAGVDSEVAAASEVPSLPTAPANAPVSGPLDGPLLGHPNRAHDYVMDVDRWIGHAKHWLKGWGANPPNNKQAFDALGEAQKALTEAIGYIRTGKDTVGGYVRP